MSREAGYVLFFALFLAWQTSSSVSQEMEDPDIAGNQYQETDTQQESSRLFDIQEGNWRLTPVFSQSLTHNDNIFLDDTGEEWDWVSRSTAGSGLRYNGDVQKLLLNYRGTNKEFFRYSDQDDFDHRFNGTASAEIDAFTFGVSGYANETSDPVDLVFTDRIELVTTSISPFIKYEDEQVEVTGKFSHSQFEYDQFAFSAQDYEKNTGELEITYTMPDEWFVFDEWFLLGNLKAGDAKYDLGIKNEYDFHEVTAGIGGNVSERVQTIVKAGFLERDHDTSTGILADDSDYRSAVGSFSTFWYPTDRDQLSINFYRRVMESVFSNYTVRNRFKLGYRRNLNELLSNHWTAQAEARYDVINEATDDVVRDRKDGLRFYTALTYRYKKWLPITASYSFEEKNTNEGGGEYENNKITLTASVRF